VRDDRTDRADEPDDPRPAGKDRGNAVSGEGLRVSSFASPDSALLTERAVAYRTIVDALYRKYDTDRCRPHRDAGGPYCPVSELKGDEPATAERLMKAPEFTGKSLLGFKDTHNPDFVDSYKRTYDAVAGPTAWASPRLNMARMIYQIQRHIYEKDGVDFTVLDLTGASSAQTGEVFKNLDRWKSDPALSPKSKLIILGGG
jgi:hypothetical protein